MLGRLGRYLHAQPEDVVLEIGAGQGALSTIIAPDVSRLIAVELDSDCLAALKEALLSYSSAIVVTGDILELDLPELLSPYLSSNNRLRIAGNLPYNIATPIIERLLYLGVPIADMMFLVQLEVAQRIIARPRTRQYGYFSVLCQHLAEVRMGFKIPPECFFPRPKVTSAVVSLQPRTERWNAGLETVFRQFTKAAFSHRRKKLANSLRQDPQIAAATEEILSEARIDGARRAEELTVEEYELLAQIYWKRIQCV
jgi:16S rRNA (adenine1518-N6/adenine1519-N6)-dimethyltransferase